MNKLIERLLVVALSVAAVCILSLPAVAQSGVDVMKAELAVDFSKIEGKLLAIEAGLVFIDDSNPKNSFLIDRDNLADVKGEGEILVVTTSRPVVYRSSEQTRLVFRLQGLEASELTAMLTSGPARVGNGVAEAKTTVTTAKSVSTGVYEVKHDHRFYGNCTGRLVVSADRISFESSTERDHSRQWLLTDVKKLIRKSPYEFGIKQFKGDGITLEILGSGMDIVEFKDLEDKVALAKTNR